MYWRLLAVALLAVVAGCGAVVGPSGPTETVTPAPVVTPTPVDEPIVVAPGVTTDGVEDLERLIDSHRRAVWNTSYAWEEVTRESFASGNRTATRPRTRWVVFEDESTYRRHVSEFETRGASAFMNVRDYEHYAADGVTYAKWDVLGQSRTEYDRSEEHDPSGNLGVPITSFQRFLALENATVTRVDGEARPHFEVRGTRSTVNGYGEVTDFRARAIVREDGLIRHVNVSFDAARGELVGVQYSSTYSRLGNATVTPPEWVSEARERTGEG